MGTGGQSTDAGGPPSDAAVSDGNVSTPPVDGGGYMGRWVSVTIKDAIIGPAKADGNPWDGFGSVDQGVLHAVADALVGTNPVAAVLAALGNPALLAVSKPDPFGWAQASVFGTIGDAYWLAQDPPAMQDTVTPTWPYGWYYQNVPIDSDVRIGVTVIDSDLSTNDAIGSAEINSDDLKDALAAQQKFEVRVDDQTDGQLLFIGISVIQQQGPL